LVKQAAIELLENYKPYLFYNNIRQWKRICNASRNRYSIKGTNFILQILATSGNVEQNENLKWTYKAYIPKSTCWNNHQKNYKYKEKLNNRPRKRFNFETQIICLIKVAFVTQIQPLNGAAIIIKPIPVSIGGTISLYTYNYHCQGKGINTTIKIFSCTLVDYLEDTHNFIK
jgi:hypothetical protein